MAGVGGPHHDPPTSIRYTLLRKPAKGSDSNGMYGELSTEPWLSYGRAYRQPSGPSQVGATNTFMALSFANRAWAERARASSPNTPNTVAPLPESSAISAPWACKLCLISRSVPWTAKTGASKSFSAAAVNWAQSTRDCRSSACWATESGVTVDLVAANS